MAETFDYIIIGAGSAGCVLANRLSADPANTVLLVEFGGTDMGPFIQMPSAFSWPMSMSTYDWGYETVPEKHLGGRTLAAPRGKVIGGSSSINGMVYVRGHARDFDTWQKLGAKNWSFADCLPYFKRLENAHGGEAGWRGSDGPLHVTRGTMQNRLYHDFIDAGVEAGYGHTDDYNGHRQEGFGPMEMTVWQGRRWSAANAYLRPAKKRKNLCIRPNTHVDRILFDGNRAIGIAHTQASQHKVVHARKEVIVSAGAFNSPTLLQQSGIGEASQLRQAGIEPFHHLPGVGKNLQDHLELYVQYAITSPISLNRHLGWLAMGKIGLQWLLAKNGLGATNHFEACGFIRSDKGIEYPDIQFHFLPGAISYDATSAWPGDGMQAHVGPNRSASRGTVKVISSNVRVKPQISFNYMSHEQDWIDFRKAIRLTREIFAQPSLKQHCLHEIQPGFDVQSDDELDDFIAQHASSAFHPCGTCKMGDADSPETVVDPQCRVIGLENLRVVDSSIFPQITNGNLNAPTLMVAEKAADLILGKTPLPKSIQQPFVHPDWQTSQR